ncbi:unnamed protein product [Phytophthora fragariaefolia]|uniref:Unnamed protein product n=1 Tax=Phytophthora fragariaefolia TaxID=1490495 RepID=A0A9W6U3N0_9STRA|nr:unnamed protein product [Phytophthora fragariaefolia]
MNNPEEMVVPLIKSHKEVDEQSSTIHVSGSPNDALDVPPGSVVEFKLQQNCPSWITHDFWVRRTNSLVDEVGPAQWLEVLRQQAAGMRALSAKPELVRGTFLDGMGGVTEPVYVTVAGLQEMDDEITDLTTDDPLAGLQLRYAASADALMKDMGGGNGEEFEYEGNEIHFEDYAHDLSFLPDCTVPASTILDYDAPNVKNPTLAQSLGSSSAKPCGDTKRS